MKTQHTLSKCKKSNNNLQYQWICSLKITKLSTLKSRAPLSSQQVCSREERWRKEFNSFSTFFFTSSSLEFSDFVQFQHICPLKNLITQIYLRDLSWLRLTSFWEQILEGVRTPNYRALLNSSRSRSLSAPVTTKSSSSQKTSVCCSW